MKTTILLVTVLISLHSLAQSRTDSTLLFESAKGTLSHPVNGFRKLVNYDSVKYGFGCPHYPGNTYFLDHTDTARAIFEGKIVSVFNVGDVYAIITKFGKYYIVYSGLTKPSLSKGEYIHKNQPLGTLYDDGEYKYSLELMISKQDRYVDPMNWVR